MTIAQIEIVRLSIPFETGGPRNGIRPGMPPWRNLETLMVRVVTEDGLEGWGEAFGHFSNPATAAALQTLIVPWCLHRDEADIAGTLDAAQRAFFGFGRSGPMMYALSGVEIALWDILAQRAGLPLYRLLGGAQPRLARYASLVRYGTPDAVARKVAEAVDRGFTLLKLHENDMACFDAAIEAAGDRARVALDVNCCWTIQEATEMASRLTDARYAWLEEPVWPPENVRALASVRGHGVAIAAGENLTTLQEFAGLFEAGAVDVVQPSAIKIGGLGALREVFALARLHGVQCIPHCYCYGPGYVATAHMLAAQARPPMLETAYVELEVVPNPLFDISTPDCTLPDVPGLGFVPDPNILDRYAIQRLSVG